MPISLRLLAVSVAMALAIPVAPSTATATAAATAAGGDGAVLVVGDSLEELTSPYLARHLPPGTRLTVNAAGGFNSYQIFDLFQESYDPSQSVIVFDAGTNDNPAYPQILAGNLARVAATVGDRCLVVPTIHGFTVNGVDNTGKNRVVREFAASRPGTQTPDWAGFEEAHPELMQADDLHPVQAGAEARAELIARGILGCLSGAPGAAPAGAGAGAGAGASGVGDPAAGRPPVLAAAPARLPAARGIERRGVAILRAAGLAVAARAASAILTGAVAASR